MKDINVVKTRYYWVDNIKFACCMLVVVGHLVTSMVVSGYMKDSAVYNFISQAIYTFHVPMFFVCSGFLYQNSNRVHSLKAWSQNVLDKLLNLGIPYLAFTGITLLMKNIFSDSINNQARNAFEVLFLRPTAPYWYLYALILVFIFIPCMKSKKQMLILLGVTFVARIFYIVIFVNSITIPYVISSMTARAFWFAIGMALSFEFIDLKNKVAKLLVLPLTVIAIALCFTFKSDYAKIREIPKYIVGLIFIAVIIILAKNYEFDFINKISSRFSEYFMPVYVMHTIASAGIRIVLEKLGVTNLALHIVCGLFAGIVLPIIAYEIAKRIPVLLFFIYPKKAIKRMKKGKENE